MSPAPVQSDETRAFRFRIIHLVYLLSLLGVSLGTLGISGLLVALVAFGFWGFVFLSPSRPRAFGTALLAVLIGSFVANIVLPALNGRLSMRTRMECNNNLRHLMLALHNYHAVHGTFPPAYVTDHRGKRMHSWRVLILPYLEEQALYDAYNFEQPWDSAGNRKLLKVMPRVYRCPTSPAQSTTTSYVAVVGDRTAWPGSSATSLAQIVDGSTNTILLIEDHHENIPWTEPRDRDIDELLCLVTADDPGMTGHVFQTFLFQHSSGRNTALADGSTRFLPHNLPATIWRQLLIINDGGQWSDADLDVEARVARRLRWANLVRLVTLIIVLVLPLPWVWSPGRLQNAKAVKLR